MRIAIRQIYIKVGVRFPFSHLFQRWISAELTSLVQPSPEFISRYGAEWNLIFNMSAKTGIEEVDIKGPTVFRKTKDVEYTVFLPYDVITRSGNEIVPAAVHHLLAGIGSTLESLGMDTAELSKRNKAIVEHISSDATMIAERRQ